jgi:putative endonuclease
MLERAQGRVELISDNRQTTGQDAEEWYVYIVECADRTFYTGITNDLERRVDRHNAGRGARYTRGRRPVFLRYHERQPDRSSALTRERWIKALSRTEKQNLIDQAAVDRS